MYRCWSNTFLLVADNLFKTTRNLQSTRIPPDFGCFELEIVSNLIADPFLPFVLCDLSAFRFQTNESQVQNKIRSVLGQRLSR